MQKQPQLSETPQLVQALPAGFSLQRNPIISPYLTEAWKTTATIFSFIKSYRQKLRPIKISKVELCE